MNCIFVTVFNNEKYLEMFYLFLESMLIFGNMDDNTNILVYTSTLFMNMIKKHILFNNKICFEINDTYNTVKLSLKSRFDIFNLPSIVNYKKIFYLDVDIIIKGNINKVFNIVKDDILYVLEEGFIYDDEHNGFDIEEPIIFKTDDTTAFTCGILLFNNCKTIKNLYDNINKDIIMRPRDFKCFDQNYMVYNAFKLDLFNNKILKLYAVNNDYDINSNKIIHHFPSIPYVIKWKMELMTQFLNNIKYHKEDNDVLENNYIIQIGSHIGTNKNDFLYNNINPNFNYIMIEPVPYLFNKLTETYVSYKNVVCLNIAISNYNGNINMYIPFEETNYLKLIGSMKKKNIVTFNPKCKVDKIRVKCKTLNSLINKMKITHIEYIYINTEGYDYNTLSNLNLSYIKPKNIIFENKYISEIKFNNLLNKFKKNGYSIEAHTNEITYIKLFKCPNIYEDIYTCTDEFRHDIYDFFKNVQHFKVAEIGSYLGYTTNILSYIFSKVYAIDNNIKFIDSNKKFNTGIKNIEYEIFNIYVNSWNILPRDIEVSFIDANHSYRKCRKDIMNSIKRFHKLQYIIFNGYGVYTDVRKIVNELLNNNILIFKKYIGATNVLSINGIVKDVHEGIICSVNKKFNKSIF